MTDPILSLLFVTINNLKASKPSPSIQNSFTYIVILLILELNTGFCLITNMNLIKKYLANWSPNNLISVKK